jgi:hypothetical protein
VVEPLHRWALRLLDALAGTGHVLQRIADALPRVADDLGPGTLWALIVWLKQNGH